MNNLNTFKWGIISLVVSGGVIAYFLPGNFSAFQSSGDGKNQAATIVARVVKADEAVFDFGTISMAAGKVSHRFKLQVESPATITKIYTSCMCTVANLIRNGEKVDGPFGMPGHGPLAKLSEDIGTQEDIEIEAVFDPAAHGPAGIGRIQRAIIVEVAGSEPLKLNFDAFVTP